MTAQDANRLTDANVGVVPDMSEINASILAAIKNKHYSIHLRDVHSPEQRSQLAHLSKQGYTIRFKPGWFNPMVSVVSIPDMIEVSWLHPKES